nr:hypothetical protein GCM10020092_062010 [Actinoplanes digitatis]
MLAPGEVTLGPGGTYRTPWAVAAWSDAGIDGLSARLHPWIRSRRAARPPRPMVLNTWEACYFDHDADALDRLVDAAAEAGVERFVLDDGWFAGRTDDRRALGGLVRRPRALAGRAASADRPGARAGDGLRAVGRARDGQSRLGAGPRAPRVGARR